MLHTAKNGGERILSAPVLTYSRLTCDVLTDECIRLLCRV